MRLNILVSALITCLYSCYRALMQTVRNEKEKKGSEVLSHNWLVHNELQIHWSAAAGVLVPAEFSRNHKIFSL